MPTGLSASVSPTTRLSSTHQPKDKVKDNSGTTVHEVKDGSPSVQRHSNTNQVQLDSEGRKLAPCGCLERTKPPPPPNEPPFTITPQNVGMIKDWFLKTYESSAFNTCPHQPLPLMSGLPPLRIHVKPDAEPVAVHKPSTIPAHWLDQVRQEVEQDIALGVLERFHRTHRRRGVVACTSLARKPANLGVLSTSVLLTQQHRGRHTLRNPHSDKPCRCPPIHGGTLRMPGMATIVYLWTSETDTSPPSSHHGVVSGIVSPLKVR
jgi:hypothetical protein